MSSKQIRCFADNTGKLYQQVIEDKLFGAKTRDYIDKYSNTCWFTEDFAAIAKITVIDYKLLMLPLLREEGNLSACYTLIFSEEMQTKMVKDALIKITKEKN